MILFDFAGPWAGSNGFRMMPDDPLAEFPAAAPEADTEAEEPPRRTRGRRRAAPPPEPSPRRRRSSGEPGDMSEAVDWAGLSSRLSAYSLTEDDKAAAQEPEQDVDEGSADTEQDHAET
jgi:hypothetical protein